MYRHKRSLSSGNHFPNKFTNRPIFRTFFILNHDLWFDKRRNERTRLHESLGRRRDRLRGLKERLAEDQWIDRSR
jgi:hypothetical protein